MVDLTVVKQLETIVRQNWPEIVLAGTIATAIYAMCKAAQADKKDLAAYRHERALLGEYLKKDLGSATVRALSTKPDAEILEFSTKEQRYVAVFGITSPFGKQTFVARGSGMETVAQYTIVAVDEYLPRTTCI